MIFYPVTTTRTPNYLSLHYNEFSMKVSALYIYPIKSLGGIAVTEAKALTEGFEYDRRWMLVNEQGGFLTQREHAQMALFDCKLNAETLTVTYKGDQMHIPLKAQSAAEKRVKVWSSKLKAQEVSAELTEWFSDHLGMHASLVKMTSISKRPKRLFAPPYKTTLSFADGYPYLILGTASMETLNNRLEQPLPIDRFRANIIVETKVAHEEDKWKQDFDLGTAKMKVIKPCARCVVTTIDQQTGNKGKEPLKTLASYRQWRNKIWFGANAIILNEGIINVGDKIALPETI